VAEPGDYRDSSLWAAYASLQRENFSIRHVNERSEIYPVFRELFKKEMA
jgi:uncharacterized sporulation protein YeaH/YhbH (DUF444 family)